MCEKWENESVDVERESEGEIVKLQVYSDHRRGDLDSYPLIVLCEPCCWQR